MINIDSVIKIDKILYPQDYLKHFKYRLKNYINNEIIGEDSDSDIYDFQHHYYYLLVVILIFSVPDSYVKI